MSDSYQIYLIADGQDKSFLGEMPNQAISFNRYNEGLLVAAGKINKTNTKQSVFMHFATQFRDQAMLEFKSRTKTHRGNFSFINFDPETHIVVFGSVGSVTTREHDELNKKSVIQASIAAETTSVENPASQTH